MKIKNTKELVLRADGHAKADRIKQGTYGSATVNGHAEFEGCAIGCLATPHRKADLRSFLRGFLGKTDAGARDPWGGVPVANEPFSLDEDMLIKQLGKEFGICPALARVAESCFESYDTHGGAIEFIPRFARSLNEGAEITPSLLEKIWRQVTGRQVRKNVLTRRIEPDEFTSFGLSQSQCEEILERLSKIGAKS